MFCALGEMPTMTTKQPFRDSKFDGKSSAAAKSKNIAPVIKLTRKFPVTAYPDATGADTSGPMKIKQDAQEDSDLPSFPGESWFGG
jgi:hypothetical protein